MNCFIAHANNDGFHYSVMFMAINEPAAIDIARSYGWEYEGPMEYDIVFDEEEPGRYLQ